MRRQDKSREGFGLQTLIVIVVSVVCVIAVLSFWNFFQTTSSKHHISTETSRLDYEEKPLEKANKPLKKENVQRDKAELKKTSPERVSAISTLPKETYTPLISIPFTITVKHSFSYFQ